MLRAKFAGKPEHVVNYFFLLAEDVRGIMSQLGFRTFQEMIGRTDRLRFSPTSLIGKAKLLDFKPFLRNALELRPGVNIRAGTVAQDFGLEERLVNTYISLQLLVLKNLQKQTAEICYILTDIVFLPFFHR